MTANPDSAAAARRVGAVYQVAAGNVVHMAQPHKGARDQIQVRAAHPVYEFVRSAAAAHGVSMSQYVADVLAQHAGRPDLVRDLNQEVLPRSA